MSEVKGGSVRFSPSEISADMRVMLGQPLVDRDGYSYLTTPFDPEPWKKFDPNPPTVKVPVLPAGFEAIFGKESDYVEEGDKTTWRQYLGLFAVSPTQRYDPVTQMAGDAKALAYGMGRVLSYELTNSARYVCFPDCDARAKERVVGFRLPLDIFYEHTEQAIALYQAILVQKGVAVKNLVPFLDPALRGISHSG